MPNTHFHSGQNVASVIWEALLASVEAMYCPRTDKDK